MLGTSDYALVISRALIKHAQTRKNNAKGGEILCYKYNEQTKSMETIIY
jgi:hypothetical protein